RLRADVRVLPDGVGDGYGLLKRYFLNCYMHLPCEMTINICIIKLLRLTTRRRAR
ncbi:unnamed protein product, partial [Amoebophrya sp. A120]